MQCIFCGSQDVEITASNEGRCSKCKVYFCTDTKTACFACKPKLYAQRVETLIEEGMCRSDAQGVAEAEGF